MNLMTNRLGQQIDLAASEIVGRRGGATNKNCWWNACRALRTIYGRSPGVVYVEGHAVSSWPIPMAHGWLELASGVIVDPTPSWHDERAYDAETTPCYFPAVRYTVAELRARGRTPKYLPYVHKDGQWGRTVPAWRESYLAAQKFVFGDNLSLFTLMFGDLAEKGTP